MSCPVRLNFRGLDDSAAEEGRTVVGAGDSTGVDGRDEERSFRAIAARKRARIGAALERKSHAQTASVLVVAGWNGGQPARCDAGLEKEKLAEFRRREFSRSPSHTSQGGK